MITEVLSCVGPDKLRRPDDTPVDWVVEAGLVDYPTALQAMRDRAAAIARGEAPELVWLVEHPSLYTAGTSAQGSDLLEPGRFPVYEAGRGGEYTYHGPGQRVAYLMLDLKARGRDVRCLVQGLEGWIIDTLAAFNVEGELRDGRIGVWVRQPGRPGGREQDRGDRRAGQQMGHHARHRPQRGARSRPFRRHRAVRDFRPRRHQPPRSWTDRFDAGGRHGAQGGVRTPFRPHRPARRRGPCQRGLRPSS